MRYLLAIFAILILAGAASAARYDWSLGQPVITDDPDTSTERYDWSLGRPTIMEDGTANPVAAGVQGGRTPLEIYGTLEVFGTLEIQ